MNIVISSPVLILYPQISISLKPVREAVLHSREQLQRDLQLANVQRIRVWSGQLYIGQQYHTVPQGSGITNQNRKTLRATGSRSLSQTVLAKHVSATVQMNSQQLMTACLESAQEQARRNLSMDMRRAHEVLLMAGGEGKVSFLLSCSL